MAHIRKLLAIGEIRGEAEALEGALGELPTDVDAVLIVGDLTAPWSKQDTYRSIFHALGKTQVPAFWVPGPTDGPIGDYLDESYNIEIVHPFLHGVHGTFALGPSHVLFAGMGGEIVDDPDTPRVEEAGLRYPGWEVEYRLKVLREVKDYEKVFLFTTQPAHKGLHGPGSEVLAELIKTYNPRLVIVAGEHPSEERLGKSLVVCPGRLTEGHSAVIGYRDLSVEARIPAEGPTV
jgi:Icc-related predicted phosphoesterase